MKVYIILLHYGEIENTMRCLYSLYNLEIADFSASIILVNNSNNQNLGFAGGMNVGIREALKDKNCSHVLILNNDTVLPKDLIIKLLETKKDITSPVIKFKWNGNWKYDFGGKIDWNIGRTFHLESNNIIPRFNSGRAIDYVSGCCMLVKREVFEKIGLLDESYFFYFEDVDFCVRARKAGFIIGVCADANIEHKLGGSIGRWSNKAIFYNLSSNAIFIAKHLGWKRPLGFGYLLLLIGKILLDKLKI